MQCNRGLTETFRVLNKSVHSNVWSQVNNYSEKHEKAQTVNLDKQGEPTKSFKWNQTLPIT